MSSLYDWLSQRSGELEEQYRDGKPRHVPTGIRKLDSIGLLEPGILTTIAAHSGDGKSAAQLQLAEGAAKAGYDVQAYFLEDPARMVADRELSKQLGVSSFALRRGNVPETPDRLKVRLAEAVARNEWARRVIADDQLCPVNDLFRKIMQRWTPNTKLVLVDYAQAFDTEGTDGSMERVVARLAWGLNDIAKKKNASVVLFSQVRREVLDRGKRMFDSAKAKARGELTEDAVSGFRPMVGDLQWSSALQQRSKQIISLFRPKNWLRAMGESVTDDVMEWLIVKGNFGPNHEFVRLKWDPQKTRIYE